MLNKRSFYFIALFTAKKCKNLKENDLLINTIGKTPSVVELLQIHYVLSFDYFKEMFDLEKNYFTLFKIQQWTICQHHVFYTLQLYHQRVVKIHKCESSPVSLLFELCPTNEKSSIGISYTTQAG